jgi:hypothetical protein
MEYDDMKLNKIFFESMMYPCLLALALLACNDDGDDAADAGHDAATDAAADAGVCPGAPPSGECSSTSYTVCSYDTDGNQSMDCYCIAGSWSCSDCPGDFQSPSATCTPGDGCSYVDWEHGCACQCNAQGRWQCTADTINSICPTGELDAGV